MPDAKSSQTPNLSDLLRLGREVLDIEREGIAAVRDGLDESFVRALRLLADCTGRVVVTGIGKSGLVGRKLAATLSSTGTPAFFLHPVEGAHGDLGSLRRDDVVLALSNSGETDELNAILPAVRNLGTPIIALTGKTGSSLADMADVTLCTAVPREACPHGLAPTASTTATLALGDALAVCLMEVKHFSEKDFLRFHPGGSLGRRLKIAAKEVMRRENIPLKNPECPQSEALHCLDRGGLGALIIADRDRRVLGILTDGDVRRALCQNRLRPAEAVSGIMTPNPRCAHAEDSVAHLLDLMEAKAITVLPLVDESNILIGIVHMHDLLGKGSIPFADIQS